MQALEVVITRYPDFPAAEMAKAKLTELGAEAPMKPIADAKPAAVLRTWSDATGKFRIEAELVSAEDGKVVLKKKDGELVTVPISKLSKEDQELLKGK